MGYTTDFSGDFRVNPPLKPEHKTYLEAFARSRRMRRCSNAAARLPDPVREAVGLPVGEQGCYYVGSAEHDFGQTRTPDILDYNCPPAGQPGLWCQWTPTSDTTFGWDEGEKFYDYVEWPEYLVEHFLKPWGYVLNGVVHWHGEDSDDRGVIRVTDNVVEAAADEVYNPLDD